MLMCNHSALKLIDSKLIKHLHEASRWKDCARLFLHDPNRTWVNSKIRIKGCAVEFYLYQAFEIFMMFEMEMFQGGVTTPMIWGWERYVR